MEGSNSREDEDTREDTREEEDSSDDSREGSSKGENSLSINKMHTQIKVSAESCIGIFYVLWKAKELWSARAR